MHTSTGKVQEVRQIQGELNGNNIIFLRGAKSHDNGHILLRTDSKANLVLDESDGAKLGQIFFQQNDLSEGVILQSVKRLGGGHGPILLLSGGDNGNGHILIQTTAPTNTQEEVVQTADYVEEVQENILVQALEGLKDVAETPPARNSATPLGSGRIFYYSN